MGVTGLWSLIEPSGKPVPLEVMENKVLAVDISIWLHQVVKGFQDNKGSTLAHAHLLGLFHRLCKLLYYRIKPVFVFDGGIPHLKRETIQKRNQSRNKYLNEADRLHQLLLKSLAQEKVVQQALGQNAIEILASPIKLRPEKSSEKDDLFKLPTLPTEEFDESCSSINEGTSESDSSFDEKNLRHNYNVNIQSIDVNTAHFKSLPADVRFDILTDLKETRKQSSWGKLHELPPKSDDFSTFQMKRLLKRRQIQVSLEDAEKQMEGKSLTLNELRNLLTEEGVVKVPKTESTRQIASDENTRFLLVRDLKKAIEKAEIEEDKKKENISEVGKTKNNVNLEKLYNDKNITALEKTDEDLSIDDLGQEYDLELQKAIQLSLQAGGDIDDDDNDGSDSPQQIKLNREQRKQLNAAADSLAKAYMIEYGEVNDDEIKEMFEDTQISNDNTQFSTSFNFQHNDKFILKGENVKEQPSTSTSSQNPIEIEEIRKLDTVEYISSESEDEVEFIDVPETNNTIEENSTEITKPKLEIILNLSEKLEKSEDIFADVFETEDVFELIEFDVLKDYEDKSTKSLEYDDSNKHGVLKINENSEDIPKTTEIVIKSLENSSTEETISKQDILAQLKNDIKNISQITLDKIELKSEVKPIVNSIQNIDEIEPVNKAEIFDSENKIIDIDSSDETENKNSKEDVIIVSEQEEGLKTPSKKKQNSINAYFGTEFVIKRTPEKSNEEEDSSTIPKVKSPFFVKKTPDSRGKKRKQDNENNSDNDEEETTPNRTSKVSKKLFKTTEEEKTKQIEDDKKSKEQLQNIACDIAKEKLSIERERNRQDRMGTSITEKMNSECMELLKLFGIPFIVAPLEAEAQCAFLDAIDLTDGTITDDSDIWLFGGRTVYKNFFNSNKHVMEFKCTNIEKLFHIDRYKLIQLAILVGSDYTTGINGIGTVTALEILATFPATPFKEDEVSEQMSILSSLRKFRDWWKAGKKIGPGGKTALRSKLKNIDLTDGFPSSNVVNAYMYPKIDDNSDKFSWGTPDIETLREFTKKKFGWTKIKFDEILQPVLKRMKEKKSQAPISNYFNIKTPVSTKDIKVSKRVKRAIDKMSGIEIEEKPLKKSTSTRNKTKDGDVIKKKRKKILPLETLDEPKQSTSSEMPSTSTEKVIRIPKTNLKIPQKEKDLEKQKKDKEKAIKLFKKLQKNK